MRRTPQVLSKALEMWDVQIIPYQSEAIRSQPGFDPVKEAAFICNLHEVRRAQRWPPT